MYRLAAILSLLALAWNISLASIGGTFICTHSDGGRHSVQIDHVADPSSESCCEQRALDAAGSHAPFEGGCSLNDLMDSHAEKTSDCGSCIDIEVQTPDLDDANATSQRIAIKTPLALESSALVLEQTSFSPLYSLPTLQARISSTTNGAAREFSDSVRILR